MAPKRILEISNFSLRSHRARKNLILGPITQRISFYDQLLVLGESGSGKTLLCRSIAHLFSPELTSSGTIRLVETGAPSAASTSREELAVYMPQSPNSSLPPLVTPLALIQNIIRGKSMHNQEDPTELLSRVGFDPLDAALGQPCYKLSGGMARRVALAATLAAGRTIVILDEPSVGLDPCQRVDLRLWINNWCAKGQAVITITHDFGLFRGSEASAIVMQAGNIYAVGQLSELAARRRQDQYIDALLERLR